MTRPTYRIGVDIGGTFTDIVAIGEGGLVRSLKVPSTPDDYGRAIVDGVCRLLESGTIDRADISDLVHATTVVTNTVLEMKGARTALVTTAGFRDILEMRRLRIPEMYNLQYEKPKPLVPRRLRFEVPERMGPDGEVWRPLDEAAVRDVALRLRELGIEAVAIALLHAYANDDHERRVEEILRSVLGSEVYLARSSTVLPEIREYERTSTTVVSAYVGPVVQHYLSRLGGQLSAARLSAPLRIVQSNGGAMTSEIAVSKPAHLLESGPAAGVIACARMAALAGIRDAISLDMGGTTAKAAMIESSSPARTTEYEVGAGINLSSQLVKGGGYAVKLPFIDVSEIGAGGGSIISLGPERSIAVGPRSAGADPGPACYGKGGTEPTFTDAMVVLGYLNPTALVGGDLLIDADLARRALKERIADPLGKDLLETAYGIHALAAATMTRAVKAVTTMRGRDPRDFALIAFGGNGPIAAGAIAAELGIRRVLVPPMPGVFSAFGLPMSETEHEQLQSVLLACEAASAPVLNARVERMEEIGRAALAGDGFAPEKMEILRYAEMRYRGQAYELSVPVPPGAVDTSLLARVFSEEHRRTYGHGSETDAMQVVNIKLVARGIEKRGGRLDWSAIRVPEAGRARRAFFGRHGLIETPVLTRPELASAPIDGPLIVEEYDATFLAPPGTRVRRDEFGNIEMTYG